MITRSIAHLLLYLSTAAARPADTHAIARAKFYNWQELDSHLTKCQSVDCSMTSYGEVTLPRIAKCLHSVDAACRFGADMKYAHQGIYNRLGNGLCVNIDENIIGLNVPDFYLPYNTFHWTEKFHGSFTLQFAGLFPPEDVNCTLNMLNADVKLETGCGWHRGWRQKLPGYYHELATFHANSNQHVHLEGSEFLELLQGLRGPGLYFIWDPEECFSPLTAYSFDIKAKILIKQSETKLANSFVTIGFFLPVATFFAIFLH